MFFHSPFPKKPQQASTSHAAERRPTAGQVDQATAAHLVEALRSGAAVAIQAPRGASTLEIAAATAAAIRRRSTQFLLGGEPSARGSRDLLFDEGGTAAEEMLLVRAAAGSAGFGGVGGGGEIQIPPPPAAWDLREFDLDALNNNNEPDILAGFEELPGGFFGGAGGGYFPVAQPQQQPRPRRSVSPPPGLAPGHRISSMDTFQEAASGAAKVAAAKGRRRSAGSRAGLGMPGSTAQIIVPLLPGGGSTRTVILRRPTITIQEDGRILIDHISARWDGTPFLGPSGMDGDDLTLGTDTMREDGEQEGEGIPCTQKIAKYVKILVPHVVLVAVLIGYLCIGAKVLMSLETRTELMARSRKLIRLTHIMENFTAESWNTIEQHRIGLVPTDEDRWHAVFRFSNFYLSRKLPNRYFREYMTRVAETVDDRRPIRRELIEPGNLGQLHNKWTFPTALLYVLTVLTTCGYSEVSVDTDMGKIFSVIFALIGIPLMFITAADIGKFLSETLLKFVKNWNRMVRKVKEFMSDLARCRTKNKYHRRKSVRSESDALGVELGTIGPEDSVLDAAEDKLWFPIGAYVACICLYCSMGSFMFMNWENKWSFIHSFHFGFNLIVTVGLGDIVVTNYVFLSLIVAFVIVGLSVVTMCVDLASTHLKAYFTRIHYFGRAKRFLGMHEELKEIVALLGAIRRKKHAKVNWDDIRDFLENEMRNRPFEPHELLMKMRFIDEGTTSSALSTIRNNSFQSDFWREAEYLRRLTALREQPPAYL